MRAVLTVIMFDNGDISIEHVHDEPFDLILESHKRLRDCLQYRIDRADKCPANPENDDATRH